LYLRQETHFYATKDAIWKTEPPGNGGGQASSFRLRRRPAASARKVPSGFSGERSQPKGGISHGTRGGDTGGQSRHLCHFGNSALFRCRSLGSIESHPDALWHRRAALPASANPLSNPESVRKPPVRLSDMGAFEGARDRCRTRAYRAIRH